MKKITFLLALLVVFSCGKDDLTGIPPVVRGKIETPNQQVKELLADEVDVTAYKVGEKVKLTGKLTIQAGRSYIKLKDNTLIQVFSRGFQSLPQKIKDKLATENQEIIVVGVFTDFTPQNSTNVIKEIVYQSENDLTFVGAPQPTTIKELKAEEIDVTAYKVGEKVKLEGKITFQNGKSYFKLKDNTLIQIFAHKTDFDALSQEVKDKLKVEGQEVSVEGVFTDFTPKNSTELVREIIFSKESDLVFGNAPAVTPPTPPTTTIQELNAQNITVADYQEDKKVKLTGKLTIQAGRSYFKLSDGTLIQTYSSVFKNLPQETKDKFNTENQEVTITGTFKTYTNSKTGDVVKQIVYETENDFVFGQSPTQSMPPANQPQSYKFDFEEIKQVSTSYKQEGTLTAQDGTILSYKARTDMNKEPIDNQGIMLNKHKDNPFVKIVFKGGAKKISFQYKSAYGQKTDRKLVVYEGDETSSTEIKSQNIAVGTSGMMEIEVNKTQDYTITIKSLSYQIIIDNISWEK